MSIDLATGAALPAQTFAPSTTRQLVQYAGASGDWNELHYDQPFAAAAGFSSVVQHGMLSMALAARYVTGLVGDPGRLQRVAARFRGVVLVGDALTLRGTVTTNDGTQATLALEATRSDGTVVLTGEATVVV